MSVANWSHKSLSLSHYREDAVTSLNSLSMVTK